MLVEGLLGEFETLRILHIKDTPPKKISNPARELLIVLYKDSRGLEFSTILPSLAEELQQAGYALKKSDNNFTITAAGKTHSEKYFLKTDAIGIAETLLFVINHFKEIPSDEEIYASLPWINNYILSGLLQFLISHNVLQEIPADPHEHMGSANEWKILPLTNTLPNEVIKILTELNLNL